MSVIPSPSHTRTVSIIACRTNKVQVIVRTVLTELYDKSVPTICTPIRISCFKRYRLPFIKVEVAFSCSSPITDCIIGISVGLRCNRSAAGARTAYKFMRMIGSLFAAVLNEFGKAYGASILREADRIVIFVELNVIFVGRNGISLRIDLGRIRRIRDYKRDNDLIYVASRPIVGNFNGSAAVLGFRNIARSILCDCPMLERRQICFIVDEVIAAEIALRRASAPKEQQDGLIGCVPRGSYRSLEFQFIALVNARKPCGIRVVCAAERNGLCSGHRLAIGVHRVFLGNDDFAVLGNV